MPIIELTSDTFSQSCAVCSSERTFALGDAVPEETASGSRLIRLPTCIKCGSVELLIPLQSDPDADPEPGSYGHLHRLLVEELDERLTPTRADGARRSKREKWFATGFKVPVGPTPQDAPEKDES